MSDTGRPEDGPVVDPTLGPATDQALDAEVGPAVETHLEDVPVPDDLDLARGEARLAAATQELRAVPSPSVDAAARRVLRAALAAPRKADLVRVAAPHDHVRVSTLVIVATLRERLDADLVGAAVGGIRLDVDRDERLLAGTVELYVQYGTVVDTVAAQARALATATADELLGGPDPARRWDVHVADVTIGDPHLVDPSDELAPS